MTPFDVARSSFIQAGPRARRKSSSVALSRATSLRDDANDTIKTLDGVLANTPAQR
jgi:hypothetical protein